MAKQKAQEPYIRVVTRRLSGSGIPGGQPEYETMQDVCQAYPAPEWCLAGTHFIGLEPGPVVDVMFIFVKAEHYIPGGALYYLSEIAEALAGLFEVEEGDAEDLREPGAKPEE